MHMERVIQVVEQGRTFTVRQDERGPLAFWRVEADGRLYLSPLRVTGREQPSFFRSLARAAAEVHGL